jgi:predicted metal-dependent phosphoesterase TrpH
MEKRVFLFRGYRHFRILQWFVFIRKDIMKHKVTVTFFSILILFLIVWGITFISSLPGNGQERWYKGNIHCHTTRSDGQLSLQELINTYSDKGYNFLVITDHNTLTIPDSSINLPPGFILIQGEEININDPPGNENKHLNGIGLSEEFKSFPGMTHQDIIDGINKAGGIPILNHPGRWNSWGEDLNTEVTAIGKLENIHHMEVYNRGDFFLDIWDGLLSTGKKIYCVASDDTHIPDHIGKGWIMVRSSRLDKDNILEAIRNGNFYASTGIILSSVRADNGKIHIASENGNLITFIGRNKDGSQINEVVMGREGDFENRENISYLWVEVSNNEGQKAWTQPLIFK